MRIYFVLEYISGGDFYRLLQSIPDSTLTEQAARFYIVEILLALEYLHNYNIVFRDLKPENVRPVYLHSSQTVFMRAFNHCRC